MDKWKALTGNEEAIQDEVDGLAEEEIELIKEKIL